VPSRIKLIIISLTPKAMKFIWECASPSSLCKNGVTNLSTQH